MSKLQFDRTEPPPSWQEGGTIATVWFEVVHGMELGRRRVDGERAEALTRAWACHDEHVKPYTDRIAELEAEHALWAPVDLPESSNIDGVTYNAATACVRVIFKGGGVYAYYGVPSEQIDEWKAEESAGQYFNRVIKDNQKHPCRKVSPS